MVDVDPVPCGVPERGARFVRCDHRRPSREQRDQRPARRPRWRSPGRGRSERRPRSSRGASGRDGARRRGAAFARDVRRAADPLPIRPADRRAARAPRPRPSRPRARRPSPFRRPRAEAAVRSPEARERGGGRRRRPRETTRVPSDRSRSGRRTRPGPACTRRSRTARPRSRAWRSPPRVSAGCRSSSRTSPPPGAVRGAPNDGRVVARGERPERTPEARRSPRTWRAHRRGRSSAKPRRTRRDVDRAVREGERVERKALCAATKRSLALRAARGRELRGFDDHGGIRPVLASLASRPRPRRPDPR